jgi:hypothetical protein
MNFLFWENITSPAYIFFQMFLYHPFLLLSLHLYAVFIMPLQNSSVSRDRSWSLIKNGVASIIHLFERLRTEQKN